MSRPTLAASLLAGAGALVIAACGTAAGTPAATPSAKPIVLTAQKTVAGKSATVLTDQGGLTLYWFKPDSATVIVCTGGCATAWPPLTAPAGTPTAGAGVSGSLTALDGPNGRQVLYNGHPLYNYSKDQGPGDVLGEGVGGKWFAATPDLAPAT